MIRHVHHTGVSTPDLDRAIRFYRDLLGFEVVAHFTKPPGSPGMDAMLALPGVGFRAALLRLGRTMLEVFEFHAPEPARADGPRRVCDHGLTHLCLQVDDVLLTADHILSYTTPHQAPESITNNMGLGHYLASLDKIAALDGIETAIRESRLNR